ncbi:MAG TPA: hypothetical protein VFP72_02215 [Kineosporiaceae bacterium]|nr:hypothetical protein [Kineosporiaceae bacterium]
MYEHPLLGEGVARLIRVATGARVVAVAGEDPEALAAVLAVTPRVVIVERGSVLADLDLTVAAPGACVIELAAAGSSGDPLPGRPSGSAEVIEAVRRALAPRRSSGARRIP